MADKKENMVSQGCEMCGKPKGVNAKRFCGRGCWAQWLRENPPPGRPKGSIPWNKGLTGVYSEEVLKMKSENIIGDRNPSKTPEARKRVSSQFKNKKLSEEHKRKISENNARYWLGKKRPSPSIETREKLSKAHKGKIRTKEHIRNNLRRRGMSMLEKRVNETIKNRSLPYKFVGDGKFFIERKNPDFINVNGEKIAVEVYCRRHKNQFRGGCDEWKMDRERIFAEYGWQIIFIEDWQTEDENIIFNLLK